MFSHIPKFEILGRDNKRKGHNGLQDDLGGLEDEHPNGGPARRHHPKFNTRHNTDRD
jgi:hypothetical protein